MGSSETIVTSKLLAAYAAEKMSEYFYEQAAVIAVGPQMGASRDEFKQHAKEEAQHAAMFADRLFQLDVLIPLSTSDFQRMASAPYPGYPVIEDERQRTEWLWLQAYKLEQHAIETYLELTKLTADSDPATNDLVCQVLRVEYEHLSDADRYRKSIG